MIAVLFPHLIKVVQRSMQVGMHASGGLVGDLDGILKDPLKMNR